MEGLEWLVTISNALVHISHVLVMANVVHALHITAEVEKYQDASFPHLAKRLMIGQLKIFTEIIKRIIKKIGCLEPYFAIVYGRATIIFT